MLLLVLQHDPEVRRSLAASLQARGVLVETAATGVQTINKAILIAPDVIVIDMEAPDGPETVDRLKRTLVTRRIPIVALVAAAEVAPSRRIDWAAWLPRDCGPETLLAVLRRVTSGRRGD